MSRTIDLPVPHLGRGARAAGVALLAAAVLGGGLATTSQAAPAVTVKTSNVVQAPGWVYEAPLTPDRVYALTDGGGDTVSIVSWPVTGGPVLGAAQTLVPTRASYVAASAGRALVWMQSGAYSLFDRGVQVATPSFLKSGDYVYALSGTWYAAGRFNADTWSPRMESLDGTALDVTKYNTDNFLENPQVGDAWSYGYVADYLGSLFLVEADKGRYELYNGGPNMSTAVDSVTLTIRDAARTGQQVGKTVTVPRPSGLGTGNLNYECQLLPDEVFKRCIVL